MSSAKKNYVYQVLYQILISALPFVTSPYISRVLGAEGLGVYSYTYSIITYFKMFAALGIMKYGNRAIAKVRDNKDELNKTFSSIFGLHAILSVVVIFAYVIYWSVFVHTNKVIAMVQVLYLVGELFDINWFYFGIEKFKLTVTRNTIIKILTVIAVFAFVREESHLWIYVLIMAVGSLISTSAVWWFLPKYAKLVRFSPKEMLTHIKPMLVLFFAVIAISVYSYMAKIMIGKMSSMSELGYYDNAWKMVEFPVGFIIALGTVMLPKISNLVKNGKNEEVERYIYESMRFSMITAVAMAFGLAGISNEFSVVFWGKEFATSGTLMKILAVTIILMSWNGVVRSQYLIPREHDRVYLMAVCTGAIMNFTANLILIPSLGALGGAIGTVCAYIGIFIVQTVYAGRELLVLKYIKETLPYVLCGVFMYILVRIVGNAMGCSVTTLVAEVVVGVLTFAALSLMCAIVFNDKFVLDKIKPITKKLATKLKMSNNN